MLNNKTLAKVLGVVLLAIGVLGFLVGGSLLGFGVNTLHNLVHLVTGAIFAWAGFAADAPVKKVNQVLGIVYIAVGLIGLVGVLGFLNTNLADNVLHLAIGAIAAAIGYKGE